MADAAPKSPAASAGANLNAPASAGANLIDGTALAKKIRAKVAEDVIALKARGVVPGLAVVLVGDDPASAVYVDAKEKASREAGMAGEDIRLAANRSEAQ